MRMITYTHSKHNKHNNIYYTLIIRLHNKVHMLYNHLIYWVIIYNAANSFRHYFTPLLMTSGLRYSKKMRQIHFSNTNDPVENMTLPLPIPNFTSIAQFTDYLNNANMSRHQEVHSVTVSHRKESIGSNISHIHEGCDGRYNCTDLGADDDVLYNISRNFRKMELLRLLTNTRVSQFDKLAKIEKYETDETEHRYLPNIRAGGLYDAWEQDERF